MTAAMPVTSDLADDFARDGAVILRGLFADHVPALRDAVTANLADPGPHAGENTALGEAGRFFEDYVNWHRFPAFEAAARDPVIAGTAAALMASQRVQLFHEHVLVKEPGTARPTPWHQDAPYYFVDGRQTVSFWVPLDPVRDATLRLVAGSHLWEKPVLPTRWLSQEAFFAGDYRPIPDPDAEGMRVVEWKMEPGDAVAFSFNTLHGARGNVAGARRRAFSLRYVGDDARYVERPGPTSPPFPGHGHAPGDRLRDDWFPTVWRTT
ncbi:phytanoyl-CoA dioxygenase family protein [Jannaschia donghaensis]|uniref:Phytanoyl-CoA dioxygenase (PhyH) n=1 Tax=Jannaschia donghaensis TaxID=420998 RepID=A0A0M6YEZ4_9RHOB|nr:phytanoyl-CoA dioxygenase family protein [Jannaschia donghaensis]CTQ48504.1 Phytanoyl-CoA dioxygenase (PhyH) [Jannaschia donghaensis]